jgi:hypothetical protein
MVYKGHRLFPTTFPTTPQPGNNVLAQKLDDLDLVLRDEAGKISLSQEMERLIGERERAAGEVEVLKDEKEKIIGSIEAIKQAGLKKIEEISQKAIQDLKQLKLTSEQALKVGREVGKMDREGDKPSK